MQVILDAPGLKIGDVVTFAGHAERYVITSVDKRKIVIRLLDK